MPPRKKAQTANARTQSTTDRAATTKNAPTKATVKLKPGIKIPTDEAESPDSLPAKKRAPRQVAKADKVGKTTAKKQQQQADSPNDSDDSDQGKEQQEDKTTSSLPRKSDSHNKLKGQVEQLNVLFKGVPTSNTWDLEQDDSDANSSGKEGTPVPEEQISDTASSHEGDDDHRGGQQGSDSDEGDAKEELEHALDNVKTGKTARFTLPPLSSTAKAQEQQRDTEIERVAGQFHKPFQVYSKCKVDEATFDSLLHQATEAAKPLKGSQTSRVHAVDPSRLSQRTSSNQLEQWLKEHREGGKTSNVRETHKILKQKTGEERVLLRQMQEVEEDKSRLIEIFKEDVKKLRKKQVAELDAIKDKIEKAEKKYVKKMTEETDREAEDRKVESATVKVIASRRRG